MNIVWRYFLLIMVLFPAYVFGGDSTYVMTLAGKTCTESHSQQIGCTYSIGKDLEFGIDGIGQPDTSITFMRSSFDGDYYGSVGVMHGCVVVKPGKKTLDKDLGKAFQFAFVSPKNGKVYPTWQECQSER